MIRVDQISNSKIVKKPWGQECWIAGPHTDSPYAYKMININAPYMSSIQFHEVKEETIVIADGEAVLHFSNEPIDCEKFKQGLYTEKEITNIINSLEKRKMSANDYFSVKPHFVHSVEAITNVTIFETSTLELEDVFRLRDSHNRPHGHVDSEHI
tara:strand:+ start:3166 stop:3630 length:465 start_codon:yes stop_codon:yes gene_type:complete